MLRARVAGGTYLRLVRARASTRLCHTHPTDALAPAPSLVCGPQGARSGPQRARRPPRVSLQRTHEPSVRSEGERHVTHASTRLCPLCVSLGAHTCALCANAQPLCCHAHPLTRVCPRALYLVWSAGTSIWASTSSPPSQCWSSTDSRTFGKERGRETRHARQHASLPRASP
jgi:hypothetical protein